MHSLSSKMLQHAHPSSFTSEVPSVDSLYELEEKLRTAAHSTPTEAALARMQSARDSMEPHITGDNLSLAMGTARDAGLLAVRDCLQLSLDVKQILANEMIEPDEMNKLFMNLGACASKGSKFMHEIVGKQDSPFQFHGQLGAHNVGHKSSWEHVDTACEPLPDAAVHTSTSGRSGAELLANAGNCIRQIGRTFHNVAGHGTADVSQSTMGMLPAAALVSTVILLRQRQRKQEAAEFFKLPEQPRVATVAMQNHQTFSLAALRRPSTSASADPAAVAPVAASVEGKLRTS
mmetsp:Transcript_13962/g.24466  ORF Transcript_13962/g.24466 Transcript_13962/m.24466 type:complete len:290 (+) Transcript_13962:106-975(+)